MSKLVVGTIQTPMNAVDAFNNRSGDIPLVLIPDDRWICSCWFSVPTGASSILQFCGADVDEKSLASPGLHIKPFCYNIAYCVTKQSNTYKAPVKSCPTKDNVMVDCDLTLVFRISEDPVEVKNFVFNLGAVRFDEFLTAATEEGIRQLVRRTLHTNVYELRGGVHVKEMMEDLNSKFNPFGVRFTECAITEVRFRGDLAKTLQATTEFDSKFKEEVKK